MKVTCKACNHEHLSDAWIRCINCDSLLDPDRYDDAELNSGFRIIPNRLGLCLFRGGILVDCVPLTHEDAQGLKISQLGGR